MFVTGQCKTQTTDYCFYQANEYGTTIVPLFSNPKNNSPQSVRSLHLLSLSLTGIIPFSAHKNFYQKIKTYGPFAWWRHFTNYDIDLSGFAFLCKLGLLLFKPRWDYDGKRCKRNNLTWFVVSQAFVIKITSPNIKTNTWQGREVILPWNLAEMKPNLMSYFKGTCSRFSACSLIKLLFSNLLLILSVNNPTHMYLRDLKVYFKVEVYFRVTK